MGRAGDQADERVERARWALDAFDRLADFVVVIDPAGDLVYANPFAERMIDLEPGEALGRNMAEFLYPDDLIRAVRVMSMMVDRAMDVPVTPAVYRLGQADRGWHPVEINASVIPPDAVRGDDPGEGLVVIFGRYSGDRDLQDRIMGLLVAGTPATSVIELIPGFGQWRHPLDHYAVFYRGDDGAPLASGSEAACALGLLDEPDAPWAQAASLGVEVTAGLEDLSPTLRAAAEAHGLIECWARPIDDPLFDTRAVIVAWGRVEASVMEVHRYALDTMAGTLALVLRWRQQVTGLWRAARHDPLTGLTNRTGFWEVLEGVGAGQSEPRVGVLYVDLDGFKGVNDAHGHRMGDRILAMVGSRISGGLRPGDVVARLGGDEFAVLCPHLVDDEAAVTIAERVMAALTAPFVVDELEVTIGASVGIATTPPGHLDADELLDAADRALYRAKGDGRGRWHLVSVGD